MQVTERSDGALCRSGALHWDETAICRLFTPVPIFCVREQVAGKEIWLLAERVGLHNLEARHRAALHVVKRRHDGYRRNRLRSFAFGVT